MQSSGGEIQKDKKTTETKTNNQEISKKEESVMNKQQKTKQLKKLLQMSVFIKIIMQKQLL